MQTTLRIDDTIYRSAKAEAARRGMTLTAFIERALSDLIRAGHGKGSDLEERDQLMEALLRRTAHFRIGKKPTRDEMNER